VTSGAVCAAAMGLALWRFATGAGTDLATTMKFSVIVDAASEHHLAVRTWISRDEMTVPYTGSTVVQPCAGPRTLDQALRPDGRGRCRALRPLRMIR
jgi:hypothetical protein